MNFLLKSVGVIGLIMLQSCGGDGQNPFISGGDNANAALRMGSGAGPDFTDKRVELSSSVINIGGASNLTVNFVDSTGELSTANGSVIFSSTCATSGAATIAPADAITIAGSSVTAVYTDINCSTADPITATATLDDGTNLTATATISTTEILRIGSTVNGTFSEGVATLATNPINSGEGTLVSAEVVNSDGSPYTDASVRLNFSSSCAEGIFNIPVSFTNATTGSASSTYTDTGCITDQITVELDNGSEALPNPSAIANLTINPLQLGSGSPFDPGVLLLSNATINIGESTNISVNVADSAGAAYTTKNFNINFTSVCASQTPPLARFSRPSATTINGATTTTYTDLGCPAGDNITATLVNVGAFNIVASADVAINPYRIGNGSFNEGEILLGQTIITVGGTTKVSVDIIDSNGDPVTTLQTVTFNSTCASASPATAAFTIPQVITNSGTASTNYRDLGCLTADSITATLETVSDIDPSAFAIINIVPLKLGVLNESVTPPVFTQSTLSIANSNLNVGENTTVTVNIVDANDALILTPVTVQFSSFCADATPPTASFTQTSAVTSNGTVTTTYRDNGCSISDTIITTLDTVSSIDPTASGNLSITPLKIGYFDGTNFNENIAALTSASITEGESTTVTVDIFKSDGITRVTTPVSITFNSSCAIATPPTASFGTSTIITSSGIASTTYKDEGCSSSDFISATLNTVSEIDPTATNTLSITPLRIGDNISIDDPNTPIYTNGQVRLGLTSISAGGTTSVFADVIDRADALITTPVTVSFESNCVGQGFAAFDSDTASTINGTASVTYTAGSSCTGTDTIRAKIDPFNNNVRIASADVTIAASGTGSIQFTSTSANVIALKGTGNSTTLEENAILTFTVFDGNSVAVAGKDVTFSLNTELGGITLQSLTDVSDASGEVQAIVQSGTVSTTVRVTASTADGTNTFSTQSTAVVISTGLPDQDSFSLSAETLNPNAWGYDGIAVNITARLSDRFNNPIQDGTNINFTTELGSIVSSCSTVDGACSATWNSQEPRSLPGGVSGPGANSGRTTILAHVIGEESFTDADGNGVYSDGDGNLADTTPSFDDIPEPFVDWDEDGFRDDGVSASPLNGTAEPFKDFDGLETYSPADGTFNGVACTHTDECGTVKTTFVSRSIVLIMAEDNPVIVRVNRTDSEGTKETVCDNTDTLLNNDCYSVANTTAVTYPGTGTDTEARVGKGSNTYDFTIVGQTNYQIMSAGTKIDFAVDNGEIVSGAAFVVPSTSVNTYAYDGSNVLQPSNLNAATYSLTVQANDTPSNDGNITLVIDSGGLITSFTPIPVDDRLHFVAITAPLATLTLTAGTTFTLSATAVEPIAADVTTGITWTSSEPSSNPPRGNGGAAVSVDTTGWVTGTHVLTGTSDSNSSIAQASISIIIP